MINRELEFHLTLPWLTFLISPDSGSLDAEEKFRLLKVRQCAEKICAACGEVGEGCEGRWNA